jgi:hypothetical protein
MRIWIFATIGCVIVLAACSTPRPMASPSQPMPSFSGSPAGGSCRDAPAWLVSRLEATLTPPGATLSRIFVVPAANLTGDPEAAKLPDPWWAGALINGAGVRPAPARWLVAELDEAADPQILAADVNARRYSNAEPVSDALDGDGPAAVLACVGPPPEP